jgi:hypothetical protein
MASKGAKSEQATIEFEPLNRVDGRCPPQPQPIPAELRKSRCAYGVSQLTYIAALVIISIAALMATYIHKDTQAVQKIVDYLLSKSNSTQLR